MIGYLFLGLVIYAIVWVRVAAEVVMMARGARDPAALVLGVGLSAIPPVAIAFAIAWISLLGWRPWRWPGWGRSLPVRS